jgi:hypothetical protein
MQKREGQTMAPTLASDVGRKSLDALLDRLGQPHQFSPDEVQELLASCEMIASLLDRLAQLSEQFLDRGTEAKRLALFLTGWDELLKLGIRAFGAARQRVEEADISQLEQSSALSVLDGLLQRGAGIHDRWTALLRWLESLPRDVNPTSLPEERGGRDATGYITLEQLSSQLHADGKA